jgi:hypothetical protein
MEEFIMNKRLLSFLLTLSLTFSLPLAANGGKQQEQTTVSSNGGVAVKNSELFTPMNIFFFGIAAIGFVYYFMSKKDAKTETHQKKKSKKKICLICKEADKNAVLLHSVGPNDEVHAVCKTCLETQFKNECMVDELFACPACNASLNKQWIRENNKQVPATEWQAECPVCFEMYNKFEDGIVLHPFANEDQERHMVCGNCYRTLLESEDQDRCPICRKGFSERPEIIAWLNRQVAHQIAAHTH